MKIKFITTGSDPQNEGWLTLERSLIKHGWDYALIVGEWQGYASKLLDLYDYLISGAEDDTDLIMYSDSYDSIMLATPEEVLEKRTNTVKHDSATVAYNERLKRYAWTNVNILWYAERACWPHTELESQYPPAPTPYKHLNGGGFIATPQQIIKLIELKPVVASAEFNDQAHNTDIFLNHNDKANIQLDYYCEVFQCMAHAGEDDFSVVNGRVKNNITGTMPCVVHFNGKSHDDEHIQKLHKLIS